jgi:virginiamycin B lyase
MELRSRGTRLTSRTVIAAGIFLVSFPLAAACDDPPGPPGPSGGAIGAAGQPPIPFFVEYPLPGIANGPQGITAGPPGDDHVWFTAGFGQNKIGHASATDVPSSLFPVPGVASGLAQITTAPDGKLWFTVTTVRGSGGNAVHCISVARNPDELKVDYCGAYVIAPDDLVEHYLPDGSRGLWGLTVGPDGNIYFTESYADRIGCFTPTNPPVSCGEWGVVGRPTEIIKGPDGNLYFTEADANRIGAFDPKNRRLIGEWAIQTANSGPSAITVGPDGDLWFTEKMANKIGRFNIATKRVYGEWPLPTNSQPSGITAGPPGDTFIWFTETGTNMIGRINAADLKPPEHFLVPTPACEPFGIAVGPDRRIWFTERLGNKVGRTFLTATEYPPKALGS